MGLALSGFPYFRGNLRRELPQIVSRTGWDRTECDIRLLCMHQIVQGATVGIHDFTFTRGSDVIPCDALPRHFAAVLAGHVHRFQVLGNAQPGGPPACPVFYPGSTARTSFAERKEQKGYLLLEMIPTECGKGAVDGWRFQPLPCRPMEVLDVPVTGRRVSQLLPGIIERLNGLDADSIVRLRITGIPEPSVRDVLTSRSLRALAPPTMTIDLRWVRHHT